MPVHNALPFVDEAVESILSQTFRDFELVIYDDGSTDGSADRLEDWARQDPRIRLTRGARNLGPAASSDYVVRLSTSPVVARMDADDVSRSDRLERQFDVLSQDPTVGMVASLCDVIEATGRQIRGPELWRLVRKSCFTPFPHGSIMFRRALFDKLGGYRHECEFWEDLDFVIRASRTTRILVLPVPLYRYRQSVSSTRLASDQTRVENALDLRYRSIRALQRSKPYEDLLSRTSSDQRRQLDPRVFLSLGLLALWSDERPTSFAHFVRRSRLRLDAATAITVLWLALAKLAPATVRNFMNMLSHFRNVAASSSLQGELPVEWSPTPRASSSWRRTADD
jgi:glycosyltransferase involved in cell wall biosynthesis